MASASLANRPPWRLYLILGLLRAAVFTLRWGPRGWSAMVMASCLWVLAGNGVLLWFAWLAPLTEQDMAQTSWLGSSLLLRALGDGPLSFVVPAQFAFLCGAAFSQRKNFVSAVSLFTLTLTALIAFTPEAAMRIGVLEDTVRIGCFVPESKECRELLALPSTGARSMRQTPSVKGELAPPANWYLARRAQVVTPIHEDLAHLSTIPGAAALLAVFHWDQGALLVSRVEAQRAAIREARVQAHLPD